MTRRLPVLRALTAPPPLLGAVVAAFPGAVLVVDGDGAVTQAWGGPASPIDVERAVGRALHQALHLPDDSDPAGALALWLACAIGVDPELFQMSLGDPPRQLAAALGRGEIELDYGPLFDGAGLTSGVVVFARAGTAAQAIRPTPETGGSAAQVESFFAETQALLEDCGAELTTLAADPEARGAVGRMFRAIHTLKGAARAAGLGPIATLAHQLEDVLAALGDRPVTGEQQAQARRLLDQLGQQVLHDVPHDAAVDAMAALYAGYRPLIRRAEAALTAWQSRPRDGALGGAFARALDQLRDTVGAFHMRGPDARLAAIVDITRALRATRRPERRLLAELDQAMASLHDLFELYRDVYRELRAHDHARELVRELAGVRRGSVSGIRGVADRGHLVALVDAIRRLGDAVALADLIDDLPRMLAPTPAALGARSVLAAAQRVLGEARATIDAAVVEVAPAHPRVGEQLTAVAEALGTTAERLTWVPLDELFRGVRRHVAALAGELGKRVEIDVDAFGAVVPQPIAQRIGDVLIHAVRNALDHGIEPPDARVAVGKCATGSITIAVVSDAASVQVDVIDDGAGVDLERLRARAVERGLVAPTTELDDHALHELVFHPGLSTAAQVSDVSGRGVGMDAIRALAEASGGTAILSSHRGRGATLTVRWPLAVAAPVGERAVAAG